MSSQRTATAWFVIGALVTSVSTGIAAPKTKNAKAAFDRGVAAYQRKDFTAASEALGESFKLESDLETLFAWAQSERQLDNCDKAADLYRKLLDFEMPVENKTAIREKLDECKTILAAQKPVEPPPPPKPPVVIEVRPKPIEKPPGRSWFDPIGVTAIGAGVISLGVGAYFLSSGSKAESDKTRHYEDYLELDARAESHGRIGLIATIGGGALIVGGIIRYATRGGAKETQTAVSGWIAPQGGGIAAVGRF